MLDARAVLLRLLGWDTFRISDEGSILASKSFLALKN